MWSRGMTRMWVGARGAMSRNATMSSSSWTFVEGISPAAILQNRQSGQRASGPPTGRRDGADEATDDAVGHRRVDRFDADPADDVLERPAVAGASAATSVWSRAWPTQRPSSSRVSNRTPTPPRRRGARAQRSPRLRGDGEQLGGPSLARRLVDLAGHPDRRRARPGRVAEDVDARRSRSIG